MTIGWLARRVGLAGLAVALIASAGCGSPATTSAAVATGTPGKTFSPQPSPTGIPRGARYSVAPSPTASRPPGTVILSGSGNSGSITQSSTSPSFYVAGAKVTVTYTYHCGHSGSFTAEVHARIGAYARTVVGARLVSGSSHESADESLPGSGDYYLTVRTDCPWQVNVTSAG
jgi:hypothetical protein